MASWASPQKVGPPVEGNPLECFSVFVGPAALGGPAHRRQVQRPAWLGEDQGKYSSGTMRLWLCVCEDLCLGLCMQTWSRLHCVWSLGVARSCIWVPSSNVPHACLHAHRLGVQTCPCSPDAFPRTLRLSSCKCVCVTFSLELCV